jgi:MraZ protein
MRRSNAIPAIKKLQRLLVGNAQDAEIDAQGRILVSPELRTYVGLDKNVTLLGLEKKFELWDQAKLDEELKEPPPGGELGSALGNFSW